MMKPTTFFVLLIIMCFTPPRIMEGQVSNERLIEQIRASIIEMEKVEINTPTRDSIARSIMLTSSVMYYSSLLYTIGVHDLEDDDLELALKRVRAFPYFTVRGAELSQASIQNYAGATTQLITFYRKRKRLDDLKSLEIYPIFQEGIYPLLKNAILSLGGTWERGDLNKKENTIEGINRLLGRG